MELVVKLGSNDTKTIGMLPGTSKDVAIQFADQCLHILNNKEIFNGLKGGSKMQDRESLFKYQPQIYNVQRYSDVNHRGIEIR